MHPDSLDRAYFLTDEEIPDGLHLDFIPTAESIEALRIRHANTSPEEPPEIKAILEQYGHEDEYESKEYFEDVYDKRTKEEDPCLIIYEKESPPKKSRSWWCFN